MTPSRVLEERIEAPRRATHLIAEVLAYHGKTGAYPASLGDLQAGEFKDIRVDPFSGDDFVYKIQGNGFTLYTVGENLKDDGGRHDETWAQGDFVFWPVQKPSS